MESLHNHRNVFQFWFKELKPQQWFAKDSQLDLLIKNKFELIHTAATCGELFQWRNSDQGTLSEVIVLDQFSRNIYRGHKLAFAFDGMALVLAQSAISRGLDKRLSLAEKSFLYMPFMHSESLIVHEMAVQLFSQKGLEDSLKFEIKHKQIIEKFGRYPHRNKILQRQSSPDELAFLDLPGSSF